MFDVPAKKAEIEAQIRELVATYNEAQTLLQQTSERIVFLQGQLALLNEMQPPPQGPAE